MASQADKMLGGDEIKPEVVKGGMSTRWIVAIGVMAIGLVFGIAGISLLATSDSQACANEQEAQRDRCEFSNEATTSGFAAFLAEVQETYYELNPFELIYRPGGVPLPELKAKFKPYDPSPANLKKITLSSLRLLKELEKMDLNVDRLKMRERKAMAQVKHFLKHIGMPYDGNYFAGDFLMGPNLFCWQPICYLGRSIAQNLRYFKPSTVDDVNFLRDKFVQVNKTLSQYVDNVRYGVQAGMVRSLEQCVAGLNSIRRRSVQVSLKGDVGIYDETYMKQIFDPKFLSAMDQFEEENWQNQHGGKSVNDSIREFALEHIGKPMDALFRFLATESMQHCVPSTVSSGLANLPLDYVYVNGSRTNQRTTKKLPTGEPLDGKKSYEMIMPYFTTLDISPDEVAKIGFDMLNKLYPEALEIARHETEAPSNDTAKSLFMQRLKESDIFYDEEDPIPAEESGERAYKMCFSDETAKKFCPKRWAAVQLWIDETRKIMSILEPMTTDMFHFTGPKNTIPSCPVDVRASYIPSLGVQTYSSSDGLCSRNAYCNIPFFVEKPGPKYLDWTINAHEVRPGHHTQLQGFIEHFHGSCGGVIGWLDGFARYTVFSEGWGLYAENPLIARDTDAYKNNLLQKYGMLWGQILRALRLIIDTGLHYKGISREEALEYFADYVWTTSDIVQKELTRYQSAPGQATAYMIGQLHIMKLRDYAKQKLGDKFDLKDFHFHLLAQGNAPLSFLEDSIHRYVSCVLDESGEGCGEVLDPTGSARKPRVEITGVIGDTDYEPPHIAPREHPL